MLNKSLAVAMEHGLVKTFDRVVILAGIPVHSPVMLNTVRVHFVGNVLAKGQRGFGGYRVGRIVKVEDSLDAELRLKHDGSEDPPGEVPHAGVSSASYRFSAGSSWKSRHT